MKYLNLFIFLMLFSFLLYGQEETLTLETCVKNGLPVNNKLNRIKEETYFLKAKKEEVSSFYLPNLKFNASYSRLSDVPAFEISLPILPAPIKVQESIANSYQFKLGLTQPIFTGFRISAINDAAQNSYLAAVDGFNAEQNEEAFKIIHSYLNLYRLSQLLIASQENIKTMEMRIEDVKNFEKNGLATKSDVLRLEVQLSNLKLSFLAIENEYKFAIEYLSKNSGLKINYGVKLLLPEVNQEVTKRSIDELVSSAIQNRKELQKINYTIESTKNNITVAKSGFFPEIYLISNLYYSNPNQRYFPAKAEFNESWDVNILLQWNIFDWGATSSKVEAANHQLNGTVFLKDELTENIRLEVLQNKLEVENLKERIKLSEIKLAQSEEHARVITENFKNMNATSTELAEAESNLLSSKIDLITSKSNYLLSIYKLSKSAGVMLF